MTADNAFFWRDEHGRVECGFIDWGRFKQDNFARALAQGYFNCDLCEFVQANDELLIRSFIEEFAAAGGPSLAFEDVWDDYLLTWCLLGLQIMDMPKMIWTCGSPHVTPEGWPSIEDYRDPRVFGMPNYSNGMVAIVRNFAYYWKRRDLPGFWARFKAAHLKP